MVLIKMRVVGKRKKERKTGKKKERSIFSVHGEVEFRGGAAKARLTSKAAISG